jgi:glycosyltransferase A (GT-A) superfamily protein (DUF2064 family)
MLELTLQLDMETATKLNLYAALSHRTAAQAAQSIVKEFLATTGEERIQARVEQYVGEIDSLGQLQQMISSPMSDRPGQDPALKMS